MTEENGDKPEASQGIVPFGIVPTSFRIGQAQMGDGLLCTVLELFAPNGVNITFWPGETSVIMGNEMINTGKMTKSGLHLPKFGGTGLRPPKP